MPPVKMICLREIEHYERDFVLIFLIVGVNARLRMSPEGAWELSTLAKIVVGSFPLGLLQQFVQQICCRTWRHATSYS